MKKRYLLIIFMLMLFAIPKVDAATLVCTKSYYSKMKARAYQTTVNYELHTPKDEEAYFTISFSNLQKGVYISFQGNTIKYDETKDVYNYSGVIEGGKTYSIELYGDEGYPCVGELLHTKQLKIPKYNKYSEREECIEYEEFPLCNKWYQGDINTLSDFLNALELYKKSLEKKDPVDLDKDERGLFEKIADFYSDHIIITGPLTVIAVAGAGYYVYNKINKKRKRVKLSDDEFKL